MHRKFLIAFFLAIIHTNILHHFQIARLEVYNESIDPNEHVDHYQIVMISTWFLSYDNDGVMCKVFPTSLKGSALAWFNRLKSKTVSSFDELVHVFELQFDSSQKIEADIDDLFTLVQSINEFYEVMWQYLANLCIPKKSTLTESSILFWPDGSQFL